MKRLGRNIKKYNYWLYLPAIVFAIITLYPMLWTLCGAINTESQVGRVSIIPSGVSFKNFATIFREYDFLLYIKNTLVYAGIVTVLSLFVNSLAAYALARLHFKGRNVVFYLILATMMIPFAVTMIPLFVVIRDMHLVNSMAALVLPSLAGGFGIFMLRQFYMGIPRDMEEAARIDGLSYFGIYWKIILPLSKPIMLTMGLFAFLACWNSYLWPLIVNTGEEYWTITTGIASFASDKNTDWNMILTGATVSMIPTAILFAVFQKQLVEGIKFSGMKM